MGKGILCGLLTMVLFFIITLFVLVPIGSAIMPVGDPYTLSYHLFSYMGITLLSGIVVTCTFIIVNKINLLTHIYKRDPQNESQFPYFKPENKNNEKA